jgi:hypothetical protein
LLEYIYERPRTRPFQILGPRGIRDRVWMLMRALYPDVLPDTLPFALEFVELEPERRLTVADLELHPVRVPHQDEDVSLAIGFATGGKRLLYSGDSPWDDRFIELARGVDLFLCECTAYEAPMGRHIQDDAAPPCRARAASVLIHLGRDAGALRRVCVERDRNCVSAAEAQVVGSRAVHRARPCGAVGLRAAPAPTRPPRALASSSTRA